MAGRMGRRTGPSLWQRIGARHDAGRMTVGKHCWVDEPPEAPGSMPTLPLQWRRDGDGWSGRVAYALDDVDGQVVLFERCLPAGKLRQLGSGRHRAGAATLGVLRSGAVARLRGHGGRDLAAQGTDLGQQL